MKVSIFVIYFLYQTILISFKLLSYLLILIISIEIHTKYSAVIFKVIDWEKRCLWDTL